MTLPPGPGQTRAFVRIVQQPENGRREIALGTGDEQMLAPNSVHAARGERAADDRHPHG